MSEDGTQLQLSVLSHFRLELDQWCLQLGPPTLCDPGSLAFSRARVPTTFRHEPTSVVGWACPRKKVV
jgi:hypothetical protein